VTADFEKHKRALEADSENVKCAHCGSWIPSRSKRCPKCGVHFRGEAFQFSHESDELEKERRKRIRRIRNAAIVVGLLFLAGVALFFTR
jgi:uncharacterized membrane protein YvbJ